MENKELKKFFCDLLLNKQGRGRKRCYDRVNKAAKAAKVIITVANSIA